MTILFAADRMYDAIRALLGAASPEQFGQAIAAQKQAADDYDASMAGTDNVELENRVRRCIQLDAGRN